jgi:cytochrome bd-type quinol oxidase subunit 2
VAARVRRLWAVDRRSAHHHGGRLYPYILPARQGHPFGLTVHNAASGQHALTTAVVWWPLGIILATVYFTFAYRLFFRKPRTAAAGDP